MDDAREVIKRLRFIADRAEKDIEKSEAHESVIIAIMDSLEILTRKLES